MLKRLRIKLLLSCLSFQINPAAEEKTIIAECARQLGLSQDTLEDLLYALATVMYDSAFVAQLLAINSRINTLAEDN